MLLKRHLSGATLIGIEQPLGERMVDFAFSCIDEVGSTSLRGADCGNYGPAQQLDLLGQAKRKNRLRFAHRHKRDEPPARSGTGT